MLKKRSVWTLIMNDVLCHLSYSGAMCRVSIWLVYGTWFHGLAPPLTLCFCISLVVYHFAVDDHFGLFWHLRVCDNDLCGQVCRRGADDQG